MSSPFAWSSGAVAVRRLLVKRPWIYWLAVTALATGAGASMLSRADRVDAERAAWGDTRSVWVATADVAPGEPLAVERRQVPRAMVSDAALESIDSVAGLSARQHLAVGEIVHTTDVVAPNGPQSLTPAGWLAVPVTESPGSGAEIGDRVRVVGDGIVLGDEAIVVGHHDGATLVAVPADAAPPIATLAAHQGVTLLLIP
jgi:SAF domain